MFILCADKCYLKAGIGWKVLSSHQLLPDSLQLLLILHMSSSLSTLLGQNAGQCLVLLLSLLQLLLEVWRNVHCVLQLACAPS